MKYFLILLAMFAFGCNGEGGSGSTEFSAIVETDPEGGSADEIVSEEEGASLFNFKRTLSYTSVSWGLEFYFEIDENTELTLGEGVYLHHLGKDVYKFTAVGHFDQSWSQPYSCNVAFEVSVDVDGNPEEISWNKVSAEDPTDSFDNLGCINGARYFYVDVISDTEIDLTPTNSASQTVLYTMEFSD